MNSVHIIRPLSLPQRLFNCLFHPLLLVFFTSVILTIWGTFSVIDVTTTKMSHTQIKRNDTNTALVSISAATATATTTATITEFAIQQATHSVSTYSLNNTFIDDTIEQYFERKLQDIASIIETDMQERFRSHTENILNNKQKIITDRISLATESIENVLEVNSTIFNDLFSKSNLINETWNEISENAMTIDEDSVSQMASNLFLNYSMFDGIFQNYSRKLVSLQMFNGTITDFSIQLGSTGALNLGFLRNSTDWVQLKKNFTTSLQNEFSVLSRKTTNAKSYTSIAKRSSKVKNNKNGHFNAVKKNIFNKCQKMTVIFTVMYFACAVLLMIIERFTFQLENQHMNLVISQINDSKEHANFTQYNKLLKSLIATSNLCVRYPIPYQLTTLIKQKILKKEPEKFGDRKIKRSRIFYCNWWIISNGIHLWLFGLLMLLIHWIIVSRLTNFEISDMLALDKRAAPSFYKREVSADTYIAAAVDDLIDDNIWLLCENFQSEVNERLIPANLTPQIHSNLKIQSADILGYWTNDTNAQFKNYLAASPRNWQEIELQVEPLLSTNSTTEFLNQYSMPINAVTNTNTSLALEIQKNGIIVQRANTSNTTVATFSSLVKRQENNQEQKETHSPHIVYKWGLLVVFLVILLHHMLTFIILKL